MLAYIWDQLRTLFAVLWVAARKAQQLKGTATNFATDSGAQF
jgi:hypothetical protein